MRNNKFTTSEKWFFFGAIPSAIVAIIVGVLFFVTVKDNDPTVPVIEAPSAGVELPISNLTGTWTVEKNGTTFSAEVTNDKITITMSTDNMNMVYWYGSFDAGVSEGQTVVSEKLDRSRMVMSGAASKIFVIGDNTMSFEATAMGVSKTVVLTRV